MHQFNWPGLKLIYQSWSNFSPTPSHREIIPQPNAAHCSAVSPNFQPFFSKHNFIPFPLVTPSLINTLPLGVYTLVILGDSYLVILIVPLRPSAEPLQQEAKISELIFPVLCVLLQDTFMGLLGKYPEINDLHQNQGKQEMGLTGGSGRLHIFCLVHFHV